MGRFNIDYFKEVSEVGEAAISALEKQKDDPQKYQNEFLLKLISENKDTEYGIRYDFGNIKNVDDFRKKVPISEYDDYKAYIERMTEKKEKNLISAYRVAHYAMSSGSTGKSKAIPVTHNSCVFSSTFVGNAMFGYLNRELIRQNKKPGLVCALFDIALKHLEDNITIGAASTTIPYNFTDKIGGLFSSPLPLQCPEKTINEAMFLKALFALKERDLSCIDATFASVVVEFLKTIEADWQRLVTAVESGKLPEDLVLEPELRNSLEKYLEPDAERAAELKAAFNKGFDGTLLERIWPNLALIFTIGGGFMSEYTVMLKHYGKNIPIHNSLYASSESILGIATEMNETEYTLFPQGVFYEFLPIGENDYSKTLLLGELEEGKDYEVIITNLSGFYRYRMLDVIHIEKRYGNTPMCHVLYRLNQIINIVGEKMTTYHFDKAIGMLSEAINKHINEYSIYADYNVNPANYKVFAETAEDMGKGINEEISDVLDDILQKTNYFYEHYRRDNLIGKATVILVEPGTYDVYRRIRILNGISPNQLKPVRIIDTPSKVRYFFGLSEGPYAALKILTVDLERQNDELRELRVENLKLKRRS